MLAHIYIHIIKLCMFLQITPYWEPALSLQELIDYEMSKGDSRVKIIYTCFVIYLCVFVCLIDFLFMICGAAGNTVVLASASILGAMVGAIYGTVHPESFLN